MGTLITELPVSESTATWEDLGHRGVTREDLKALRGSPILAEKVAMMIMHRRQDVRTIYNVDLDYGLSYDQMLERCTSKVLKPSLSFPVQGVGKHIVGLELVPLEFGPDIEGLPAPAYNYVAQQGLELGRVEHLLAFEAKYPYITFPIVAFGSSVVYGEYGHRNFPWLCFYSGERRFSPTWTGANQWPEDLHFLGIYKSTALGN